jgi:hypothetical protein
LSRLSVSGGSFWRDCLVTEKNGAICIHQGDGFLERHLYIQGFPRELLHVDRPLVIKVIYLYMYLPVIYIVFLNHVLRIMNCSKKLCYFNISRFCIIIIIIIIIFIVPIKGHRRGRVTYKTNIDSMYIYNNTTLYMMFLLG